MLLEPSCRGKPCSHGESTENKGSRRVSYSFMAARSGKLRVIPRSAVAPPLITTEQLRMMTVPVWILTVRNSVSMETVRKQYGTVLVLRIALFTVIQGRPGRVTFACMEAGGISRVESRVGH